MTEQHRQLLAEYQAEMREAMSAAQSWWRQQIDKESAPDPDAAEVRMRRRWPDGAASHPIVIGTILKYLHLCDRLNRTLGPDQAMDFNRFLIDGLDTRETRDISRFTDALSYWPIGVTENNELV